MNIKTWLKATTENLGHADIATSRLDCLVLLSDELGKDKAWLLSHAEYELQRSEIEKLSTKIAQRALHTPLAYIRGKTEFYGREFMVNKHVLEPRPESETIIEVLKTLPSRLSQLDGRSSKLSAGGTQNRLDSSLRWNDKSTVIVDVGTGSGALAITAKLELPEARAIGIDIDPNCLEVAQQNAAKHAADVTFLQGNLLQPLETPSSKFETLVLLCNLPYVPDNFHINRAASHEPALALFGGPDGLDLYRTLFEQTKAMTTKPTFILAESLPPQHVVLAEIAKAAGYSLEETDDFIQLFRYAN